MDSRDIRWFNISYGKYLLRKTQINYQNYDFDDENVVKEITNKLKIQDSKAGRGIDDMLFPKIMKFLTK